MSCIGFSRHAMLAVLGVLCLLTLDIAARAESLYDQIKARGVLNAGVRYDYPPFGSIDDNNQPVGFGPAIAAEVAKRMGVQVHYVQVISETRIPMVTGGHEDAEFATTTATVQRNQAVDFTIPYLWDSVSIIVRKDSDIKDITDIKPPRIMGASRGSNNIPIFKDKVHDGVVMQFDDYQQTVLALKLKKIDAIVINHVTAQTFVSKDPSLEIRSDFYPDPVGIMVRQDDSRWRNFLNFTLQKMYEDGTYQKIYKETIGGDVNFQLFSEKTLQPGIEKWDGKP
jgi:polar amino acid transport system substrate-binding protein